MIAATSKQMTGKILFLPLATKYFRHIRIKKQLKWDIDVKIEFFETTQLQSFM